MPSKRKRRNLSQVGSLSRANHIAFFPLLILSFALWLVYRGVFHFSVLFDEVVGKAIFFGLPVWLYILVSGFHRISDTFAPYKMKRGLMVGLAVGGLFAFAASTAAVWQRGAVLQSYAFLTDQFWWEFFLALITGFWETLFFFSFVMSVVQSLKRRWSFMQQILFVAVIFLLFHLPNIVLRFQGIEIWYQVLLLTVFALGQALLFHRERNGYSLVISHALWGMVLLLHF